MKIIQLPDFLNSEIPKIIKGTGAGSTLRKIRVNSLMINVYKGTATRLLDHSCEASLSPLAPSPFSPTLLFDYLITRLLRLWRQTICEKQIAARKIIHEKFTENSRQFTLNPSTQGDWRRFHSAQIRVNSLMINVYKGTATRLLG